MKTITGNDYYKNRLKPPKAFYDWCYSNMRTYVWENKQQKIVASPLDHKEVIKKRLGKNSRLTFFDDSTYFEIILSTKKRIERQTYKVLSCFENGIQQLKCDLINLHCYTNNEYINVCRIREGEYSFGKQPILTGMWYAYEPTLFPNNWVERLESTSELKYLNLEHLTVRQLPLYYKYRERLEFIQNIKARGLEREFYNETLDFRVVNMNWLKRWRLYLRNSKHTYAHVRLKQKIESIGGKLVSGIEPFLNEYEVDYLPTQMSVVRFQNYLIRQQKSFRYYEDYIDLLEELELEITNKRRFPKNLVQAHDEAVDTINALERESVREEFEVRAKELSAMEMTIDRFAFLLPKSADDLMNEGKSLEHCVGLSRYINRHAEGETTIVFVRQENEPNVPYYTLELQNNEIVQLYGKKNSRPTDDIRQATREWLTFITKLSGKEQNVA